MLKGLREALGRDLDSKIPMLIPDIMKACFEPRGIKTLRNWLQQNIIADTDISTLTNIDLSSQFLYCLPEGISMMTKLKCLNLSNNLLSNFPCSSLAPLRWLERLNFSGNQLKILPQIINFECLRNLDLSANQLQSLPSEIGALESLQWLQLSHNRLRSLPPEIGSLLRLEELNLHDNRLHCLPQQIRKLSALRSLNLRENHFRSVPAELNHLTGLQFLDLATNEIRHLFDSPVVQTLSARPLFKLHARPQLRIDVTEYAKVASQITQRQSSL
mmetsp:Transcript_19464/g.47541  ORF Transcript_19464/g.47541 Transcript_19464/m.47541 type:complete len:273 (+) Transcript_19464:2-820(+)